MQLRREFPKLLWDLPAQLVASEIAAQHPKKNLTASAGSGATGLQCHGKQQPTCRRANWQEGLTAISG